MKVIDRVFCKNELWYYLVTLSTGESGLIVASDFEIMTTLVELSMEGKSNLLRINIEEPKDNTRIIGTQTRKSEERQFKPKHNIMNLFTRN